MKRYIEGLLRPSTPISEDQVQYWRERIVAVALTGAIVLGTGAYGINMFLAFRNRTWFWAIIYTLAYVGVVWITFSRNLAYNIRAGTMLVLLFVLGIISGLQYGTAGDARIWFFGFAILSGVFLGLRAGLVTSALGTLTLLGLGMGMNRGWITPPVMGNTFDPANFSSWVSTSIPFLALAVMTVLALGVIINGLNLSLQRGSQLTEELERDQQRLQRRTQALERREVQVRTAAEINRVISAELDPDKLFQQVCELIRNRFDLYYVGVFLIDESGLYAVLRSGTGEAGKAMLAEGHRLPIGGTSMVGWAISRRQARIALDTGQDAMRFDNPHLPDTHSELALPMMSGPQVLGALTVQSAEAEAFDKDDIVVLQSIADGLAIAIENARLFQQTQANLEEIRRLHQQYLGEVWSEVVDREAQLSYTYESADPPADKSADQETHMIDNPLVLRDQVIGKITLESDQPEWSEEDRAFIDAVTTQAALALENVRLVEETQRTAQYDRIVAEITSKAWASSDVNHILRTTLSELGQVLQASDGLIQLDTPHEAQRF